jgi:amino acid permease
MRFEVKVVKRLRLLILGGFDGVLYSAIMLLLVWQIRTYEYAQTVRESQSFGHLPVQLTSNERWVPMILTWIVTFALAALLVDHFWRSNKASVWFWEAIGLVAVAAWNVFILSGFWLEKGFSSQGISYAWVMSSSNPVFGPISLGVVLIVNFLYAQAVLFFEKRTIGN